MFYEALGISIGHLLADWAIYTPMEIFTRADLARILPSTPSYYVHYTLLQ